MPDVYLILIIACASQFAIVLHLQTVLLARWLVMQSCGLNQLL